METDTTELRVGVRELRDNLSAFMQQVQGGTVLHVTSHDKVIAEVRLPPAQILGPRKLGALRGKIRMAPDFNETPADIIESMEKDF